ncbi:MAG TPA: BMP family ABC transporter substrate-binding protein [Anaerolineae bacterium]|nr:BMP family ABC transporter substrate-binding protein [Anaerolineae bacterium]
MLKKSTLIILAGLLAIVLAACSSSEAQPQFTPTPVPQALNPEPFSVGLVTAIGGIEEKFFTRLAWKGIERAGNLFPIDARYAESATEADFASGIEALLAQDTDLIITIGQEMADATAAAAKAHPDTMFAMVDASSNGPNVRGIVFDVVGVSYMAGYLAGGMSKTGVVCTYGAADTPVVTDFMTGFVNGADYYRRQNGVDLDILGWDVYAKSGVFLEDSTSEEEGYQIAKKFFAQGCDVIFAVAKDAAKGSARAAQEENRMFIGTIVDWYETFPEYGNVVLTSVMKNTDQAVFQTVAAVAGGSFRGGEDYVADLHNDGVALAPYHRFETRVSQGLRAEVNQVRENIMVGLLRPAEPWIYEKTSP